MRRFSQPIGKMIYYFAQVPTFCINSVRNSKLVKREAKGEQKDLWLFAVLVHIYLPRKFTANVMVSPTDIHN